ncbi:MAG: ABC transporter permease subunit [Clostridia bacterium]|nr:ABC transporter permease subunit [Clostridia bacterium]
MNNFKKVLKIIGVSLLWLAVWQAAAMLINQEILLPTPLKTIESLFVLGKTADFYASVLISLLRIVLGYILGVVFGILGGIASNKWHTFDIIFSPIIKIIKAVPVASFIILALVWFHAKTLPVFIVFLMVLPMIWSSVQTGLQTINPKYLEMAKIYNLSRFKTFFKIKVPFIMPALVSTALTALGFAWKSGIAAEVICRPENSIGDKLQSAKLTIETPEVFALTAIVALLSILLEAGIKKIAKEYLNDKSK